MFMKGSSALSLKIESKPQQVLYPHVVSSIALGSQAWSGGRGPRHTVDDINPA